MEAGESQSAIHTIEEMKILDTQQPSTNINPRTVETISFLRLPREIRDQVYQYSLLRTYVEENGPKPAMVSIDNIDGHLDKFPAGSIVVSNDITQTFTHNVALLRVSRQVHEEASVIWKENLWILMKVNKNGFAEDMRQRGFPAKRGLPYKPAIKPALSIMMRLDDADTNYEWFTMPHCAHKALQRVISKTGGRYDLTIYFDEEDISATDKSYARDFVELSDEQLVRVRAYGKDAKGHRRNFFNVISSLVEPRYSDSAQTNGAGWSVGEARTGISLPIRAQGAVEAWTERLGLLDSRSFDGGSTKKGSFLSTHNGIEHIGQGTVAWSCSFSTFG